MFEDAKVGDRVWSSRKGWGTVDVVESDRFCNAIKVMFDNGQYNSFNLDGKFVEKDVYPELYWDEVKITPPPKPKKKVIKEYDGHIVGTERDSTYGQILHFVSNFVVPICGKTKAKLFLEVEE